MTKGNWLTIRCIAMLMLAQATTTYAFENVSPETVQSLINQKQIKACETFCVQSIDGAASGAESYKLIATNNMSVNANLALETTLALSSANTEYNIPAQTSYFVYNGEALKSFTYTAHPVTTSAATHNNNITYELPWERGKKHISLNDRDDYFEFSMPLLTPVIAARAGTIVGIKDSTDIRDFTNSPQDHAANEIIIQHDDNSFGIYKNIAQNGALVSLGDNIGAGESIAFSGQTGNAVNSKLTFYVTVNANYVDINFIADEGIFSYFTAFEPYTAVHANSTIEPDLSFESDLGLGSNGDTSNQETIGDTGGDINDPTSGGNAGGSGGSGNGGNTGGEPDGNTGNETDGSNNGDSTGDTNGDSGNEETATGGNPGENEQPASGQSSGGGGGSNSPILMIMLTLLYIYRKYKRAL